MALGKADTTKTTYLKNQYDMHVNLVIFTKSFHLLILRIFYRTLSTLRQIYKNLIHYI